MEQNRGLHQYDDHGDDRRSDRRDDRRDDRNRRNNADNAIFSTRKLVRKKPQPT